MKKSVILPMVAGMTHMNGFPMGMAPRKPKLPRSLACQAKSIADAQAKRERKNKKRYDDYVWSQKNNYYIPSHQEA